MKILLSLILTSILLSFVTMTASAVVGKPFVIVNKATNKVAFIDDNKVQNVYPAGTGRSNELTPEGLFTVKVKAVNPYFRKKNIPGGDPRNPLGTRWIGFDALGTDGRIYGLHGTNNQASVGRYISNGCVRLRKVDIESLYERVPIGTKVFITHSPKDFATLAKEQGFMK
ncbi:MULTISPECIES: L,D-transpeptidase [Bacillaceae]|uniref:Lipoprotein-anchoring transpeptidase ErfK/SrfK n=1 Tax=Peribacillus huizhouensis TaxID=1501239 RepID=A0ABR6CQM4_9BACI|nr:lipoprotein-anchoring transpeptidase ErfK/SrfK [Peribacillus huizhouensis]